MTITFKESTHLIFQCPDGDYVQLVVETPGAVAKLNHVLGINTAVDRDERGMPKMGAAANKYFGDLVLIGAHLKIFDRDVLLTTLWNEALAAESIHLPGE